MISTVLLEEKYRVEQKLWEDSHEDIEQYFALVKNIAQNAFQSVSSPSIRPKQEI